MWCRPDDPTKLAKPFHTRKVKGVHHRLACALGSAEAAERVLALGVSIHVHFPNHFASWREGRWQGQGRLGQRRLGCV